MKSALLQLLAALLLLAFVVAGYGMWYTRVSALSARVASLESQIEAKTQAALRVSSARALLAAVADNEAIVGGYFVPESGVVDFIDRLEALATSLGATLVVRSVAAGKGSGHPTLTMELTVTGSFDPVVRSIGTIEFAPYDLSVTELALRQGLKNSWGADLSIELGSTPAAPAPAHSPAP